MVVEHILSNENKMDILIRHAKDECFKVIVKEGTLAGAKCMCEKLTDKKWQDSKEVPERWIVGK